MSALASEAASNSGLPPAGLILAGGRSSRFGGDKALAVLGGVTLLERAARALAQDCGEVAVSVRVATEAEALAVRLGLPVAHDAAGEAEGPLAGIKAGLIWAKDRGYGRLLVRPVDVPAPPADLSSRLIGALGGAAAAYAQTSDGLQPLCSLWTLAALPALAAALAQGAHPPVRVVLQAIGARAAWFEAPFANVNRPEDLQALEGR